MRKAYRVMAKAHSPDLILTAADIKSIEKMQIKVARVIKHTQK